MESPDERQNAVRMLAGKRTFFKKPTRLRVGVHHVDFIDILQWGLFGESFESSTPLFHAISIVIHLVVYAISFPIWIIGITLLYFNQRIRKEGFDIEMQVPQPNTVESDLG